MDETVKRVCTIVGFGNRIVIVELIKVLSAVVPTPGIWHSYS